MKNLRFLIIVLSCFFSSNLLAQEDQVFARVGNMPVFSGCENIEDVAARQYCSNRKFQNYLKSNLKEPTSVKGKDISGYVLMQFVVRKTGKITDIKVLKSLTKDCDTEAFRLIKSINEATASFRPGTIRDKKVSVRMEIPVYFGEEADMIVEVDDEISVPPPPPPPPIYREDIPEGDLVFTIVDEMPSFPGCETLEDKMERKTCTEKNLLKYMYQNIKYPTVARENGIQGLVVLQFVIEEDGSISNATVLRGIGGGCDEESIRVVESMNDLPQKWTPGKQKGKAVKVRYNLPIRFKLEGNNAVVQETEKDEIFLDVDFMPIFPGCKKITDQDEQRNCSDKKMKNYIAENLQYPLDALENNVEGSVVVQFVVTETGKVVNLKIIKGLSKSCDAEAIRVINSMNTMPKGWTVGMHKRKSVKVQYSVPIYFNLSSMSEKEKRKLIKKLKKGK